MKYGISIKTLIVGLGIFSMVACSDEFLDKEPLDERVELNFYKTESDATEALTGIYDVMQWNTVIGFHPLPMIMDIASDDTYAGGASRTDSPNIIEVDMHNIRPTNQEMYGLWKKYYTGIYRANIFLEKIDQVEASEDFKERVIAEAKFLRAYFYADLVRLFENVPLLTKTLKEQSEYAQPQAEPAAVYNQIAKDLYEAIPGLPTTLANDGRITRWAAESLLARVYLFYNGVYNADLNAGEKVINRAEATALLEDVINNSGHGLLDDFAENFKRTGEYSKESVFEISYSDVNPWYDWDYVHGGEGNIAVQMQGPRVKDPEKENFQRGWSFSTVTQELVDAFDANDPRKNATLLSASELSQGIDIGFQHTGYFNRKYTTSKEYTPEKGPKELNWGNNYRVIRFSDVLLMAAELHALGGNTGKAKDYLDMVRARVGQPSVPATIENIYRERRLELALEGHRYWDLLRRGVQVADSEISVSGVRGPNYVGDQIDFDVTFKPATKGFFPIPQSEIDITNGTIKQNTGY